MLFVNTLLSISLYSQSTQQQSPQNINKDSLKNIYGKNKEFIPQYELQSLVALIFYPELKNTAITFRIADIESIARTTVTFFSVLHITDKHFIIYINNNKNRQGILLQDAPLDAQAGAIGHELAHVADFNKKDLLEMVWWGIKYLNKKSRINIERKTDVSTIAHGLGLQLYKFVDFVLNHSEANDKYKKFKRLNYLSPDELLNLTQKSK